jgi:hypothetical protein
MRDVARSSVQCAIFGGVTVAWAMSVACGSASGGAAGPYGDAGGFDTGSGLDSSVADSGAHDGFGGDSGAGDTGVSKDGGGDAGVDSGSFPTTAVFVQGSPSLPDVRLCFAPSGSVLHTAPFPGAGEMPGSNYPGVPLGGAASMGDATELAHPTVILYAIDAQNLARLDEGLANQYTCDQLVCPGGGGPPCLRPNLDYWSVPMASGVYQGRPNVVALSGCLPAALDPAATTDRCGSSWTALSGNLHADVVPLSGTFAGAGQIAVQAAQLSPSIGALFAAGTADAGDAGPADGNAGDGEAGPPADAAAVGAVITFGEQDAGDASVIAVLTTEGSLQGSPQLVTVGSSLAAYGSLGFAVDVPGLEGGAGHMWMSLAQAQQLVDPTQDPSVFFGQNRTYVVAVLGDPNAPHAFTSSGGYDGKGLHVLVVASAAPAVGGDP